MKLSILFAYYFGNGEAQQAVLPRPRPGVGIVRPPTTYPIDRAQLERHRASGASTAHVLVDAEAFGVRASVGASHAGALATAGSGAGVRCSTGASIAAAGHIDPMGHGFAEDLDRLLVLYASEHLKITLLDDAA